MRKAKLIAALGLLALAAMPAFAEDQLKVAIGQINNWENQAPTLGQTPDFQKHGWLRMSAPGRRRNHAAVISGRPISARASVLRLRALSKGARSHPRFTGTGDLFGTSKPTRRSKA